jgi:hypothetical protein
MSGIDRLKISSSRWSEIGEGLTTPESLLLNCRLDGGAYGAMVGFMINANKVATATGTATYGR